MTPFCLIDPGHGRDAEGNFRRPIMELTAGGNARIARKRKPGGIYYQEDMGTLWIAHGVMEGLQKIGYSYHVTRRGEHNAHYYFHRDNDRRIERGVEPIPCKDPGSALSCVKALARHYQADLLVSIHTNALSGNASGVRAKYDGEKGKHLAECLVEDVAFEMGLKQGRISDGSGYKVLRGLPPEMPRVILEAGFHDHPVDLGVLTTPGKPHQIGLAIAYSIQKHFDTRR